MTVSVLSVISFGFVLVLSGLDLWASERLVAQARPRPSLERRCPYCHRRLDDEGESETKERLARCASCGTWHHEGCLAEHGGCSIYGCKGRFPRGKRLPVLANAEPAAENVTNG